VRENERKIKRKRKDNQTEVHLSTGIPEFASFRQRRTHENNKKIPSSPFRHILPFATTCSCVRLRCIVLFFSINARVYLWKDGGSLILSAETKRSGWVLNQT
jgi:hypothetical protein